MQKNKKIIIISGPTGVGKTKIALDFAETLGLDIISADSRQVYKKLDIGTAKPTQDEQDRVKHHLIDFLDLNEKISAGKWVDLANEVMRDEKTALIVGGTAFYISSLINGLDEFPEVDPLHIENLNLQLEQLGIQSLQSELQSQDPVSYEKIDVNNPHRMIRALSVIRESGKPFSDFLFNAKKEMENVVLLSLGRERSNLYDRINKRVDLMIQNGLLDEVKSLIDYQDLQSLQTVGYQEFFPYFEGEYDLNSAVELVKRNTRRYAKRQMTWFRNQGDWKQLDAGSTTVDDLLKYIK